MSALAAGVLLCLATAAGAARADGPAWVATSASFPTNFTPGSTVAYTLTVTNVGSGASSGTVTVVDTLPPGLTVATPATPASGPNWTCPAVAADATTITCTRTAAVKAGSNADAITLRVSVPADATGVRTNTVTVFGGNAADCGGPGGLTCATATDPTTISTDNAPFGVSPNSFFAAVSTTQAGAHPNATTSFTFNTYTTPGGKTIPGNTRNVEVALPVGVTGNPLATPQCSTDVFNAQDCPDVTAVGQVVLVRQGTPGQNFTATLPVYNLVPKRGEPARFGFQLAQFPVFIETRLRPGDYGLNATVVDIPTPQPVVSTTLTFWGVPADHNGGGADVRRHAFMNNPTACPSSDVTTTLLPSSWDSPLVLAPFEASSLPATGCSSVSFDPGVDLQPSSTGADSASGLAFDLTIPQSDDPDGLMSAQLKKAVVTLPDGVAVNPSAAAGLQGCSDAQIALGSDDEPTCPDGAKIGSVEVTTPLLEEHLTGDVFLGTPKSTDPQSGEMFRLFIVVRNDERGLLVKLPGSAIADPKTGQLTATFDNNPQLPFSTLHLELKGGDHGLLAMPQACGGNAWSATLTPWTAADDAGGAAVSPTGDFAVGGDCSRGFNPALQAGMSVNTAGASGTFAFSFSRRDGQQWFSGLTAMLPAGLLASIRGVPVCSNADAAAGTCSSASRIGSVDAGAGSGSPYFLEKKGATYLTEGYKGCAYGLSVVVPVEAGPFTGEFGLGNIVVRQAICVDPTDAHVTVVSDPFPTIWHGIPLRVRVVTVRIDRAGFMLNPTNCDAKRVSAAFLSVEGSSSSAAVPFQSVGCAILPFAPKLAMQLLSSKQTHDGGHPGLEAVVTQLAGEAGIKTAKVTLPLSLALDPENADSEDLCDYAIGQAVHGGPVGCPASSIVGRATAVSPLLNRPLTGNVYFVRNVRYNAKGQAVRTLPTLLIPLRGEIAIDLRATSDVDRKGRLVNTFAAVPDAPISTFHLTFNGGRRGILIVTHDQDLCKGTQVAFADIDGQNGKRHDFNVAMARPCPKPKVKVGKAKVKERTVTVAVTIPSAGRVTATGANGRLGTVTRRLKKAGTAHLTLKLTEAGRLSLKRRPSLKVRVAISFVPEGGGTPQTTQANAVTLRHAVGERTGGQR